MSLHWEGERADREAAQRAVAEHQALLTHTVGEPITVANEFADVVVQRVETRNGTRLLIQSPKSGQWITLDALEVEALTWQNTHTLAAMVGNMFAPLLAAEED